MQTSSKKHAAGIAAGFLLTGSQLSAQTVTWGSTAVPMSNTALVILTALFALAALWIFSRSRKHAHYFGIVAALLVGTYGYSGAPTVEITTASGSAHLSQGDNLICNAYTENVTITGIDPEGHFIDPSSTCHVGTVLSAEIIGASGRTQEGPSSCCTILVDPV